MATLILPVVLILVIPDFRVLASVGYPPIVLAIPVFYATTRICWALGIPFGISREFLDSLESIAFIGLGLAPFALVGAVLTLGLVQRWGVIFPRWIPGVRGKPVPIGLAVNSALIVSALVGSAGCFFIRVVLSGKMQMAPTGAVDEPAAIDDNHAHAESP